MVNLSEKEIEKDNEEVVAVIAGRLGETFKLLNENVKTQFSNDSLPLLAAFIQDMKKRRDALEASWLTDPKGFLKKGKYRLVLYDKAIRRGEVIRQFITGDV